MTCRNKELQALLPAHLERSLDQGSRAEVERHVAVCGDCRTELALLRMMAEEPVPDPGEMFWSAMPGRMFREVEAQKRRKESRGLPFGRLGLIVPRWAWAVGVIGVVALVSWLLVRPAAVDVARMLPENGPSFGDLLPAEPIDMAELTDKEMESVDHWATEELALMNDAVIDLSRTDMDISIFDRLAELSSPELERFSRMLDTRDEEG